jgi:hypothetical protein
MNEDLIDNSLLNGNFEEEEDEEQEVLEVSEQVKNKTLH